MRSFDAETPYSLPEHFVGMLKIGIHFVSEYLPSLYCGLFHCECCGLSFLSVPRIAKKSRLCCEGVPGRRIDFKPI